MPLISPRPTRFWASATERWRGSTRLTQTGLRKPCRATPTLGRARPKPRRARRYQRHPNTHASAWRSAVGARYAIPSYDEVALEHWGESCRPVETLRALRCPWQPRTERTPAPNARSRRAGRVREYCGTDVSLGHTYAHTAARGPAFA